MQPLSESLVRAKSGFSNDSNPSNIRCTSLNLLKRSLAKKKAKKIINTSCDNQMSLAKLKIQNTNILINQGLPAEIQIKMNNEVLDKSQTKEQLVQNISENSQLISFSRYRSRQEQIRSSNSKPSEQQQDSAYALKDE